MGRWDKLLVDQASDVPSIIFFPKILQNSLQKLFQFIFKFFFHKITKMKIKSFECLKSIRNYEKKTEILGTSDKSHRPSEPAYYIVDCRILVVSNNSFALFPEELCQSRLEAS